MRLKYHQGKEVTNVNYNVHTVELNSDVSCSTPRLVLGRKSNGCETVLGLIGYENDFVEWVENVYVDLFFTNIHR